MVELWLTYTRPQKSWDDSILMHDGLEVLEIKLYEILCALKWYNMNCNKSFKLDHLDWLLTWLASI